LRYDYCIVFPPLSPYFNIDDVKKNARLIIGFMVSPYSTSGGQGGGAWRFAHIINCMIRFAPCALRFAHNPLKKLLINRHPGPWR
jgi:hypothetical protein